MTIYTKLMACAVFITLNGELPNFAENARNRYVNAWFGLMDCVADATADFVTETGLVILKWVGMTKNVSANNLDADGFMIPKGCAIFTIIGLEMGVPLWMLHQ